MMLNSIKQRGFTLVEVLLAITLGIFVIGGTLGTYLYLTRSSAESINSARLDHELRSSMSLMANDIRRAGYWAQAISDLGNNTNSNPFMAAGARIQASADTRCILFSFDFNRDGTLPVLNAAGGDERFGFRVSNQVVQMRPLALASFSCATAAANWDDVTDPDVIQITNLAFTLVPEVVDIDGAGAATETITVNRVAITLTGRLTADPTVTRTLTEMVRVRNDIFTP